MGPFSGLGQLNLVYSRYDVSAVPPSGWPWYTVDSQVLVEGSELDVNMIYLVAAAAEHLRDGGRVQVCYKVVETTKSTGQSPHL